MDKIDLILRNNFSHAEKLFSEAKYHDAIKKYKEILADHPKFVGVINNIGLAYECLNEFEKSLKFYKKCSVIHPEEKLFINNLANIFYKMKDYKNAIKEIDKSLLIEDFQIKVIEIKASCLIRLNLRNDADLFFKKYLKKFSNNKFLNTLHGKNLINLNKHKLGLQFLKIGTGFVEFKDNKITLI